MNHLNETHLISTRLLLRNIDINDNKAIFALRSNPEINKYLSRKPTVSLSDADRFIQVILTAISTGDTFYWAICMKNDPELLGTICLWNFSADRQAAEIGYELLPTHQGKGIMSEAMSVVLNYAFKTLKMRSLKAITHFENQRSTRLLLQYNFVRFGLPVDNIDKNNVVYVLENPYSI